MKKSTMMLFAFAVCLTGCSETLDFRNAEVSNGLVYKASADEPFSGLVTNVPVGVIKMPKIGDINSKAANLTGDPSAGALLLGTFMTGLLSDGAAAPIAVCDVEIEDGRPEGEVKCRAVTSKEPAFEFTYQGGRAVGGFKVYSVKHAGEVQIDATLDGSGALDGKATVYNPANGKLAATYTYAAGVLEGEAREYNPETGKLMFAYKFVSGKIDGEFLGYGPDGETLVKRYQFNSGAKNGKQEDFDPQTGKLVQALDFDNGLNLTEQRERDAKYAAEEARYAAERAATEEQSAKYDSVGYDENGGGSEGVAESVGAIQPSFDCTKASGTVEMMICGSSSLSTADLKLAQAYKRAMQCTVNAGALKAAQRSFVSKDRNSCADESCVASVLAARTAQLENECAG